MAGDFSTFFRKQAKHCRWLANNSNDPHAIIKLNNMARDYEERAAAEEGPADGAD